MKKLKIGSIFLSGILLMLSLNFYFDWQFEDELLTNLSNSIKTNCPDNPDSLIIHAMNTAMYIESRQTEVFSGCKFNSVKAKLMSSSFTALNYGGGACGSYTLFLARLLKKMGFKTKMIEVYSKGSIVKHISLGIERGNKLLLVDPYNNHAFTDRSGRLSDIHEVAANWFSYYSKHLPANYVSANNYQHGWRYTNWDKFGFLSRSFFKMGSLFIGESKMNELSIRYYFLETEKCYSLLSFLGFLLFIFIAFSQGLKRKKNAMLRSLQGHSFLYRSKMNKVSEVRL